MVTDTLLMGLALVRAGRRWVVVAWDRRGNCLWVQVYPSRHLALRALMERCARMDEALA